MSDEFERKSSKKGGIIALVVILLIAAIAGTVYYFVSHKKNPDKLFEKAIEDVFQMSAEEKSNSESVELELSAEVEGNNAQIKSYSMRKLEKKCKKLRLISIFLGIATLLFLFI